MNENSCVLCLGDEWFVGYFAQHLGNGQRTSPLLKHVLGFTCTDNMVTRPSEKQEKCFRVPHAACSWALLLVYEPGKFGCGLHILNSNVAGGSWHAGRVHSKHESIILMRSEEATSIVLNIDWCWGWPTKKRYVVLRRRGTEDIW